MDFASMGLPGGQARAIALSNHAPGGNLPDGYGQGRPLAGLRAGRLRLVAQSVVGSGGLPTVDFSD